MKVFIFDLDDTIIYHPFGQVNYNDIGLDVNLFNLLDELKFPKIIYTNGTYGHAEEILNNMKLTNLFTAVYARDTMPAMKPHEVSFRFVEKDIRKHIDQKNKYYFFEDRLESDGQGRHVYRNPRLGLGTHTRTHTHTSYRVFPARGT